MPPLRSAVSLNSIVATSFFISALGGLEVRADVALAAPISDGLILQRGKPIVLWGTADPGESISINFKAQSQNLQADAGGRWRIALEPEPASAVPATLEIKGENTLMVRDVLVGEVWLCSGQSNMNHPLSAARDAQQEIAAADFPLIRHFSVESTISPQPTDAAGGSWRVCSPQTAGEFTAVGFFFARALHRELGVPVGIIKSTLGGSPIEAWIGGDVLASTPASQPAVEHWKNNSSHWQRRANEHAMQLTEWHARADRADSTGQSFEEPRPKMSYDEGDRGMPSGLFNAFIHPLRHFRIAGFLWYQGEGNAHRADDYSVLFPLLIRQWRQTFQDPKLPFLFVQLPNFIPKEDRSNQTWAALRAVQADALSEPHTGMAVTIDVGDPHDIHPANKQDVGWRLALIALRQTYGRQVPASGPVFRSLERRGAALVVHFDHAAGLAFRGDPTSGFVIAGADKRFVPATARIDDESVILSAEGVLKPSAVRFAWENNPTLVLKNSHGLPAGPFEANAP